MKTPPTQAVEMLQAAKQVNGLQHAGVQVTSMDGKLEDAIMLVAHVAHNHFLILNDMILDS